MSFKSFYKHVIGYNGQNSFCETASHYAYNLFYDFITRQLGNESLSDNLDFALRFFIHGQIGTFMDYINDGFAISVEDYNKYFLIVNNYGKHAFDIMPNYVNVTIPLSRPILFTENTQESRLSLNDSQMKIYSLLKLHPEYTIKDLVRESELSDGYVRKILTELKTRDYIQRIGSNKTGYWKVNPI